MAQQFEIRLMQQLGDIAPAASKIIVDAKDIMSLRDKTFAKMATDEACTASDNNSFLHHPPTSYKEVEEHPSAGNTAPADTIREYPDWETIFFANVCCRMGENDIS